MEIRRFRREDAGETARVVAETLRISNSRDYSPEYIEETIRSYSAQALLERAEQGHFYVVCDGTRVVGCGGIAPYWGSETESILLTVFILPEYQGRGLGQRLIQTLERDEYFLRAKRVEIPASITACGFYQKMGYAYKNGVTHPDGEGCIRLEKRPEKKGKEREDR